MTTIKILSPEDYAKLSVEEKHLYITGPNDIEDDNLMTFGVQGVLYGLMNDHDPGDLGLPEFLLRAIDKFRPEVADKAREIEWGEKRTQFLWDYFDECDDRDEWEFVRDVDVFIVDEIYEALPDLIEEEAEK